LLWMPTPEGTFDAALLNQCVAAKFTNTGKWMLVSAASQHLLDVFIAVTQCRSP
jgi:hypothetical protein